MFIVTNENGNVIAIRYELEDAEKAVQWLAKDAKPVGMPIIRDIQIGEMEYEIMYQYQTVVFGRPVDTHFFVTRIKCAQ